ncbi:MAG: acyltransferase [Candidatus Helarchaeota archaeon]
MFIGQGSFFSRRAVEVGKNSSLGAYCVIGSVKIGEEVLIASRVSISSGRHQHGSSANEKRKWGETDVKTVQIGDRCWIGEGAIVLADVGEACIISAGSVIVKPVPDYTVAVGNPARPIKQKNENCDFKLSI